MNYNYRSKNLDDFLYEILFCPLSTVPSTSPLALYHYTNDEAKQKIVSEETHTVKFRFTRASQFTDKNECTYIIEPYVHACGCLYNSGAISKEFYFFLKSIKADCLNPGQKDPWIICFTTEGNSQFMKEKYAPRDGWIIELLKQPFESLESNFSSSDTMHPNYIFLAEVEYSYIKIKNIIQEMLSHLYSCYQNYFNDDEEDEKEIKKKKKDIAKAIVIQFLSMYSLFYKSDSYKDEKEIRLICNINPELIEWQDPDDSNTSLYFENGYLFLKLNGNSYRQSFHALNAYNSVDINKPIITSQEIRDALRKRKEAGS